MQAVAATFGLGLLAGCLGDGAGPADRGSGIRWSGPTGADPWRPAPFGFGADPFGGMGQSRTVRPSFGVVCDRATQTCYRGREIDASETRDVFGRRAAREVDRIRDAAGTNRIYRVDDDVVCNRRTKVCLKNGHPDNSETKDFFGRHLPK